ncbi:hypothetical protein SynROS8604_00986 [Synechococcus sp. ROS8604]|nr:hypothetical protein SynROS8604_00986 [Synechococcus sp. ROS8604]
MGSLFLRLWVSEVRAVEETMATRFLGVVRLSYEKTIKPNVFSNPSDS